MTLSEAELDLLLRSARALNLISALSLFGTALVAAVTAPFAERFGDSAIRQPVQFTTMLRATLLVNLVAAVLWLPLQTLRVAAADDPRALAELIGQVLVSTTFGQTLLLRSLALIVAIVLAGHMDSRRRLIAAVLAAGLGLGLQARLGHAAAADAALGAATALHVVAAGAWIGGLVPLALILVRTSGPDAVLIARRFSLVGIAAVTVILGSAAPLAWTWIGNLGGWFGTDYGLWAIAKLVGLLLLLLLAALNRVALTPRLAAPAAHTAMLVSIGLEAIMGFAVIIAAVHLATLPPGAHETPQWPFPVRPDLRRIDEPFIRLEIERAAIIGLVSLGALISLLIRRLRLAGPVVAGLLIAFWLPWPNLRLLMQPAYPTSYQVSETGYSSGSIVQGLAILRRHCTSACFRPNDDPSDLTPYGVWRRPDGDLFWWLGTTFDRIGHSPFPHGTIATLASRERWQLIDYLRARAAGTMAKRTGHWPSAVLPPDLQLRCDGRATELRALRGQVVVLTIGRSELSEAGAVPAGIPLRYVHLNRDSEAAAGRFRSDCTTDDPDAWTAYAIVAGIEPEQLDGAIFVIDANGWLRAWRSGDAASETRPDLFAQQVKLAIEQPFAADDIGSHRH